MIENNHPVASLPNILTLCNIIMGLGAIITTAHGNFTLAGVLIITGALFDRLDGQVARRYSLASEMGKQLDSLADVITFGIAPAIAMYMLSFAEIAVLGFIIIIIFVVSGVYRLARFNTLDSNGVFIGLPITIAGLIMALLILFQVRFNIHPYLIALSMLLISYLMICKREIKKV